MKPFFKRITILGLAIMIAVFSTSCSKGEDQASTGRGPGQRGMGRMMLVYPVETQVVQTRPVTYMINAVGSVDAFEKVQVTARVAGVVERVLFFEGKGVRAGDVLVEIEPERYRLMVESAQAAYEKSLAAKADAEAGLKRRETVSAQNPGLIPGEELETWRTKVRLAISDVAQANAALDQAKLNLHDAYVRAPVSGIIQSRSVQTGQYMEPGTIMATLLRRDPMLLRFPVLEDEAAQLQIGMKALFRVRNDKREYTAKIVHVAASADEGTRMVAVVAEVNDPKQEALRPGSFTEVTVPVGARQEAPVIPQTAIRASERGFLGFVVENGMAYERILNLGLRTNDGQVEVLSGLKPGEILVIRGAEALRDGVQVRLDTGKPPVRGNPEKK